MKFFAKLFLCTLLILTGALAVAEYFSVSASLSNAVEHQVESGLQQHQLVKFALQSGILNASRSATVDENTLRDVAQQTAEAMSVELCLAPNGEEALYSNVAQNLEGSSQEEGYISCLLYTSTESADAVLQIKGLARLFQQALGKDLILALLVSQAVIFQGLIQFGLGHLVSVPFRQSFTPEVNQKSAPVVLEKQPVALLRGGSAVGVHEPLIHVAADVLDHVPLLLVEPVQFLLVQGDLQPFRQLVEQLFLYG